MTTPCPSGAAAKSGIIRVDDHTVKVSRGMPDAIQGQLFWIAWEQFCDRLDQALLPLQQKAAKTNHYSKKKSTALFRHVKRTHRFQRVLSDLNSVCQEQSNKIPSLQFHLYCPFTSTTSRRTIVSNWHIMVLVFPQRTSAVPTPPMWVTTPAAAVATASRRSPASVASPPLHSTTDGRQTDGHRQHRNASRPQHQAPPNSTPQDEHDTGNGLDSILHGRWTRRVSNDHHTEPSRRVSFPSDATPFQVNHPPQRHPSADCNATGELDSILHSQWTDRVRRSHDSTRASEQQQPQIRCSSGSFFPDIPSVRTASFSSSSASRTLSGGSSIRDATTNPFDNHDNGRASGRRGALQELDDYLESQWMNVPITPLLHAHNNNPPQVLLPPKLY